MAIWRSWPNPKYNLPQGTTLTPIARIPLGIDVTKFKPDATKVPDNNFWDNVATLQIDNLGRDIVTDIIQNVNNSRYITNIKAVTLSPIKNTDGKTVMKIEGGGGIKSTAKPNPVKQSKFTKLNFPEEGELPTIEMGGKEISVDFLVRAIKEGLQPVARRTFSGSTRLEFVNKPSIPVPRLYVIEEYRINSYLGDYGAGKILKTFTLLPGEKTTITMRTFKQITSKQVVAQNVLESVSEEVVDSLEAFVQDERQNSSSSSSSTSESVSVDVSVGCDFGFASASVDVGYASSSSSDQARTDAVNSLSNSMDRHTAQSNTNREINVNSSTEDSSTEEQEETIVRELENINYSRVLNFIFRQMQQQYISVTTLNNIKILFTNGYPESVRMVNVEKLKELLEEVLNASEVDGVYEQIINEYCQVRNYQGNFKQFLTNEVYTKNGSITGGTPIDIDFWTAKNATDSFDFLGAPFEVPGIILEVKERTLQTDSAVCDALLGQMDALDCFNMQKQEADAEKTKTESEMLAILKSAFETATGQNKIEYARNIGRLMTNCCDVPQSSCGCGDTPPTPPTP